jgi:uncharacterized OsmC-like protein
MVRIEASYEGNLRCTAIHTPSGAKLITDAPVDNHGKGESFSPTDLLATSMLTCILTIIGIRAQSRDIDVRGLSGSVEKTMSVNPRRVGRLDIMISLPSDIDLADREWLISEGCRCPVCSSVNEKMEVEIRFSD